MPIMLLSQLDSLNAVLLTKKPRCQHFKKLCYWLKLLVPLEDSHGSWALAPTGPGQQDASGSQITARQSTARARPALLLVCCWGSG